MRHSPSVLCPRSATLLALHAGLFACFLSACGASQAPDDSAIGRGGTSSSGGGASAGTGGSTGAAGTAGAAGAGNTTAAGGAAGAGGTGALADAATPPRDGGTATDARAAADVATPDDAALPNVNTAVTVDPSGAYSVTFARPNWTFGGDLGAPATNIARADGSDALGSYSETTFTYLSGASRQGRIRAYTSTPVVVFAERNAAAAANARRFPRLSTHPQLANHLTYTDTVFGDFTLTGLTPDSPWVFFDDTANAFILSGASHFMNTETTQDASGSISSGIAAAIANLPAGFEQTTVLVADPGINLAFGDWGRALLRFGGKTPVANDAIPELAKLGYWTDNGATYYYATQGTADYRTTLIQARDYFQQLGTPIGYLQLDSWWYRKGATGDWLGAGTNRGGTYLYEADTTLFPAGLAAFQQSLALPLVAHNRWIDVVSPYRAQFTMSNNVSTDPAFWSQIAAYIKNAGVATYEQDWMNEMALPSTTNLVDQDAFLDNMARAMAAAGINIQYCMPLPKHYLQSTKYPNVVTSRVSNDRFNRNRWKSFLYGSRLASAVGEWPWSDVFKSTERDNLLLSTLSAGMVGLGDAINAANKANILRAVRADGVIVKPDVPIVAVDQSVVNDARAVAAPTIATTFSSHPGGRTTYLFAFTDVGSIAATFRPSDLGYSGDVFVYDVNKATGRIAPVGALYSDTITDTAYYIVAPVGPSGIALLGDIGKFASIGRQRISTWSDDGTLTATIAFAAGETVTLQGYAPTAPTATASTGTVGPVTFDAAAKRFTVLVSPAGTTATIGLKL
jgi:hypothetical protein